MPERKSSPKITEVAGGVASVLGPAVSVGLVLVREGCSLVGVSVAIAVGDGPTIGMMDGAVGDGDRLIWAVESGKAAEAEVGAGRGGDSRVTVGVSPPQAKAATKNKHKNGVTKRRAVIVSIYYGRALWAIQISEHPHGFGNLL
ncbi:MAG: hypothetical protein IH962_04695 [Chloroflexi bacterium]|nr:hypothetical protein [Chloroflexota bacterium]